MFEFAQETLLPSFMEFASANLEIEKSSKIWVDSDVTSIMLMSANNCA